MHILPILLALSTASCVLQKVEQGQSKEAWQGIIPAGCVEQLSFVREDVEDFLDKPSDVHRRYDYKDKQGCKIEVTISSDYIDPDSDKYFKGFKSAIDFMDEKEISCSTANDGGLMLNFPHDKDKKYPQVKFPCNTKEIAISRIPTWREIRKVINDYKPSEWHKHRKDNEYYKDNEDNEDNEEQTNDSFGWRLGDLIWRGLFSLPINFAANWGELFSDYYRTFRKPAMGGLVIVYSAQQGILRHRIHIGTFSNTNKNINEKGHPYGAVGVSKKGVVAYHIMVDNKGKKQMLYQQN